jgi:hypothetical protein
MNRNELPEEVVAEIVRFLEFAEANTDCEAMWSIMPAELESIYYRWRDIIRAEPDLLDGLGTMWGPHGLSAHGRLFLLERKQKVAAGPLGAWEEYIHAGQLLTTAYCKERFGVTSSDCSKDPEAKRHRRPNPEGRDGGDFVYRYKDVARVSERKDRRRERKGE